MPSPQLIGTIQKLIKNKINIGKIKVNKKLKKSPIGMAKRETFSPKKIPKIS